MQPALLKKKRKKLVNSTKGTDPATEDPAKKEGQDCGDERKPEGSKDGSGSQGCGQTKKRVKMKKDFHPANGIFTRETGKKKEIKKKGKEKELT
jgi:hypothetical protein